MSCDECKVTDDERASRLPLAESKVDAYIRLPNPRFEAPPIPFGGGAAIPYAMPFSFDVPARRRSSRGDTTKKPTYIEIDESDADDKEDEGGKAEWNSDDANAGMYDRDSVPPGEEATTPIPLFEEAASPFATPPSSSISSSPKPGLVEMKINFTPISPAEIENQVKHTPNSPAKHTANSLYTLGNSSEEEDYAVEDSQDY
jgi:hypothetical protein